MEELVVGGTNMSPDDKGRLHFWGEVFNIGEATQRWVRITVRLLNAQNVPLAEESDLLGLEWTLPGARNPFHLRFLDPPKDWHSYDIQISARVHDYNDLAVPQPNPGVLVDKLHYREIGRADLRCSIIGLLSNRGLAPATHVKAAGTLYDQSGNVVGVLSPYLVPRGVLGPGDSMPFELKFYALGGTVTNYSVQAQGRSVPS